MLPPFSRARATLLATIAGALLASAAQAADMPYPVELPPPVNEGPTEWGTNWYLRGQVGGADYNITRIDGMVLSRAWPSNWTIGLGGGYQFNNWFRVDATVDYQELWRRVGTPIVFSPCFGGAGLTVCSPTVDNHVESINFMANAYIDLGNWWGLTPYIGGGIGANVLIHRSVVNWSPAFYPFYSTSRTGDFTSFAYAGMAGVAYDIDSHWKIDLGYRWINLGTIVGYDLFNNRFNRDLTSHQVRLGFRYMID